MINPKDVAVCIPCATGEIHHDTVQGLVTSGGLYSGCWFVPGCSEVNLARNISVSQFMRMPHEWMVFIDSDIGFSRQDFEYLLSGDELAVYAPYSRKDGTGRAAEFGLGFARVHKSVFEKMMDLRQPDSNEPSVNFFVWQGEMVFEFFPSFANAQHHWSGEDHSFWKLVQFVGVTPRVENRVKLRHWGRMAFVLSESQPEKMPKLRCPKLVNVNGQEFQCEHDKDHEGVCVTTAFAPGKKNT